MSILFGHPTGNPNSHHAALAHYEAGRLGAFCVPWMPSALTLQALALLPPLRPFAERLGRRRFPPLAQAPLVQGHIREWLRLAGRLSGFGEEALIHDANDWLMRTMRRECRRPAVTAVHAYEDCALWPFEEASRLGKACIYDMPTVFYPEWERIESELTQKYSDWLPASHRRADRQYRFGQKRKEMDLADIVLTPSRHVEQGVRAFYPEKVIALAPYGVDLAFWTPPAEKPASERLRFISAGQVSLRKGIPCLIAAWEKAALRDAELELVGSWNLADGKRLSLPSGIIHRPHCAPSALRERYRSADVLVFPSFSDGFGLVLLEAMACGLPAIASEASAAPEIVVPTCGRVVPTGDIDAMVESLRWFDRRRDALPAMGAAARAQAEQFTWNRYRARVAQAVAPYV